MGKPNLEYKKFIKIFWNLSLLTTKYALYFLIDQWPGNCKIVHGKPRCPWVQGKVEQSNGTLQRILTSKLAELETDNWVDLLPDVMYVMNINLQNSTKTTPYNIMFG